MSRRWKRFRDAPIPAEDDKVTVWANVRWVLGFALLLVVVAYGKTLGTALYLGFWAGWFAHQAKDDA